MIFAHKARKQALDAMMKCLGYFSQEATHMYSPCKGTVGGPVILGSVSGASIESYLESAVPVLLGKGFDKDEVADCIKKALNA